MQWAYSGVLDVLRAFRRPGAGLGGLVDVPELHPPVEQKGIVGHLVRGQLGRGEVVVLVHRVDAIGPVVGAGLLGRASGHLHLGAVEQGARSLVVLVSQKVVVDVCV